MKGFKNTTRMMSGHGFAGGGPVGGVVDFRSNLHGSSSVRRETPSSVEDEETGGKSPLRPGYAHGGKSAKHFHVHKHYHSGGEVKTNTKSYSAAERAAECATEGTGSMMAKGRKAKKWIAGATKNKGALHRALHVPEGKKIPQSKLVKAEHSKNSTMRKRAALAETLKGMHHASGGTIGRMNAGGALYATGGGINRLAPGGQPMMPGRMPPPQIGALGALAARAHGPPMRRAMPIPGRMAPGPLGSPGPTGMARGGRKR